MCVDTGCVGVGSFKLEIPSLEDWSVNLEVLNTLSLSQKSNWAGGLHFSVASWFARAF